MSKNKYSLRKKFVLVLVIDFFLAALVCLSVLTFGTSVLDSRRADGTGKARIDNSTASICLFTGVRPISMIRRITRRSAGENYPMCITAEATTN